MNKKTVLKHFGGKVRAVAKFLDVSTQYISQWPELVPEVQAARLEILTNGELEYRLEDYVKE